MEVDDHALHIEEHTRYIESNLTEKTDKQKRDKIISHIHKHKKMMEENEWNTENSALPKN